MNKLYVEYRVYFDPKTNQDLLRVCAESAQEQIYDIFELDESSGPTPAPNDVTFEIKMEVTK